MTKQIEDGGPAFPVTAGQQVYSHGMTLRDWFAGQAMIGLCSGINSSSDAWLINCAADLAYQIADAMLEARK